MKTTKNLIGLVSGIGLLVLGVWLLYLCLGAEDNSGRIVLCIYGSISLILGVYMFFNLNKEDKIEQIRKTKQ